MSLGSGKSRLRALATGAEPHSTLTGFELGFHFLLLTFLGPLKCTVPRGCALDVG